MTIDKEMMKALEADGGKLRQMTGEDHGPRFIEGPPQQWFVCDDCAGEGEIGTGRMSHTVTSGTIDPPDEIMEQCKRCRGAGGWLDDVRPDKRGGPTETDPDRPCCKPDGSCCDFCCGN